MSSSFIFIDFHYMFSMFFGWEHRSKSEVFSTLRPLLEQTGDHIGLPTALSLGMHTGIAGKCGARTRTAFGHKLRNAAKLVVFFLVFFFVKMIRIATPDASSGGSEFGDHPNTTAETEGVDITTWKKRIFGEAPDISGNQRKQMDDSSELPMSAPVDLEKSFLTGPCSGGPWQWKWKWGAGCDNLLPTAFVDLFGWMCLSR